MISQSVTKLYEVEVTGVGEEVELFKAEKMIILFNEDVPPELRDICVWHTIDCLEKPVEEGDVIRFDDRAYRVKAIGTEANRTLRELGHCTLKFDGGVTAEMPGHIHLEDKELPPVETGTTIQMIRST